MYCAWAQYSIQYSTVCTTFEVCRGLKLTFEMLINCSNGQNLLLVVVTTVHVVLFELCMYEQWMDGILLSF